LWVHVDNANLQSKHAPSTTNLHGSHRFCTTALLVEYRHNLGSHPILTFTGESGIPLRRDKATSYVIFYFYANNKNYVRKITRRNFGAEFFLLIQTFTGESDFFIGL
jgi:hypothetical protein